MFSPYDTGAPAPSYLNAPSAIPQAPVSSPLMDQINGRGATSIANPSSISDVLNGTSPTVENAIATTAPKTGILGSLRGALGRSWSQDSPAITGEEATGLLAKTPYSLGPLALTLAGGYLQGHTSPGSQPHSLAQGLSTGGTASGAGLLGGSVLAGAGAIPGTAVLPITAGLAAGGLAGGYINSRLAAHDVNFGPFHWGSSPHAVDALSGGDPIIQHLVGVASDEHSHGNISTGDFATIIKQAELDHALGTDPKTIAVNLQQNIVQAAQLNDQRKAAQVSQISENHRQLREQLAIAKLMQPDLQGINQSAKGLQDQIAAAHLTGPMAAWGQLLGQQTVNQGHRQTAAITASEIALPQIQALMQQISAQNAAQQAANYYAARQTSATSSSSPSLSTLLNQTPTTAAAGAGGASGGY